MCYNLGSAHSVALNKNMETMNLIECKIQSMLYNLGSAHSVAGGVSTLDGGSFFLAHVFTLCPSTSHFLHLCCLFI